MRDDEAVGAGYRLGYARAPGGSQRLEAQIDTLTDAGVEPSRIYSDRSGAGTPSSERPGWAALLDYARPGDTTVVVGVDRLGRTAREVLSSARELTRRRIGLQSLREGVDTADPAGAMIVGVLASLAELDDEEPTSEHRRSPHRRSHAASGVGRPRALDETQAAAAERMRAAGHPVPAIAAELGVSRATLYRTLAERRTRR
ncbi:recombinase family protein [Gordonia sihwensis]|uniref:recombinase family protein n=1 Tax=Gordonia sihwensis TaxID=173559 RepID=UPI0005F0878E|nr:recombinase family protein [Gordonia sihwensis]KJR06982.1 resolvase [Gordonia sihwensis]